MLTGEGRPRWPHSPRVHQKSRRCCRRAASGYGLLVSDQHLLFDQRFLDRYAGSIISDPSVALIELIANAWDAFATEVEVQWPDVASGRYFTIRDNGAGMTAAEFEHRWGTLDYNRSERQGHVVAPPPELAHLSPRHAYGRNGRGRHAAFHFGAEYRVKTRKAGEESLYRVYRADEKPFDWERLSSVEGLSGHGTEITSASLIDPVIGASAAREIIGTRFLFDPHFTVSVDGKPVTFEDIPDNLLRQSEVEIVGLGIARVMMVDSARSDRSSRQHGIAWHVGNRLVGSISWSGSDYERVLDGRTSEARRYTFIVKADFLEPAVKADWSGFETSAPEWQAARQTIQDQIATHLSSVGAEQRRRSKASVRRRLDASVRRLAPLERERLVEFAERLIDNCPSLGEAEIEQITTILANLERADSQYSLLAKLHEMRSDDLDDLNSLLEAWTLGAAKRALDEIETRLKLIEELDHKLRDSSAREVQHLQPLMESSLWVFGPEFESVEFTSNKGMTEVIKTLLKADIAGTQNRPDFVVLPDGSVGFYSRDAYDSDYEVTDIESLVIVEIKRPGIPIGSEQKDQAWKYAKELLAKGLVSASTRVSCFVLGSSINAFEGTREEGNVTIRPMAYETFIRRAEARMLGLRKKLRETPFLQEVIEGFTAVEPGRGFDDPELDLAPTDVERPSH